MVKIKICGIRRTEDVEYVNAALPDYIGFVFAPSKRQVTPEQAAELQRALDARITPVGVFVNAPISEIAALYQAGVIRLAQLHGGEGDDYIQELKLACGVPVLQVVRHGRRDKISACADYILFDAASGGSGTAFDWQTIPECDRPWFLAGGIDLSNIGGALALKPYAVDCGSGSETDGVKDETKIRAIVASVRNEAIR